MDIQQLRYFSAIAKTGSMSRAAELLNISQPALSKVTKILQEELGVPLIRHVGRQIILTEHGQRLAERSATLIQDFEKLKVEIENRDVSCCKDIKIATFEVFSTYALDFINHLDWEQNTLSLHEVLPGELEEAVANKKVDVGITYMPVPHPDLEHLKVTSIDMGVFSHPEAFPDLIQNDFPYVVPVMPITGTPSRVRGLDGWPDDVFTRKVKYRVTLLETALELCRQKKAAGFFPVFVVNLHNKSVDKSLRLIRRPGVKGCRLVQTDVYIVKRKSDVENKFIKQLAKGLRAVCNA